MSPESKERGSLPHFDGARETFCQELVAGAALYEAFETAGFKRPRGNAQRILREPEVAERIAWLQAKVAPFQESLIGWRREQHRQALENIATADRLALFVEKNGTYTIGKKRRRYRTIELKPLDQLTSEQRALIDGIKISDKGQIEVLMPKRLEARAMLAKLDGFDKPTKISPTDPDGNVMPSIEVRFVTPSKKDAA